MFSSSRILKSKEVSLVMNTSYKTYSLVAAVSFCCFSIFSSSRFCSSFSFSASFNLSSRSDSSLFFSASSSSISAADRSSVRRKFSFSLAASVEAISLQKSICRFISFTFPTFSYKYHWYNRSL